MMTSTRFEQSQQVYPLPPARWVQADPFAEIPRKPSFYGRDAFGRALNPAPVLYSQGSMRIGMFIRPFQGDTAFDIDLAVINAAAAEWLPALRKQYTLKDKDCDYEEALSETPKLYPLLNEAIAPLRATFPANTIYRLEALRDDDAMIRVVVKVPAERGDAAEMMKSFKQNWWYRNSYRSNAALIFDYETGDGV